MQNKFIPGKQVWFTLAACCLAVSVSAQNSQKKMVLEKTRNGKRKEIACNNFVKVWYQASHKRKVRQGIYRFKDRNPLTYFSRGRVIGITDSALYFVNARLTFKGMKRDTFVVATDSIISIQRYARNGRRFTSLGINVAGTVAPMLIDPSGGLISVPIVLWTLGTMGADAASDRLVYPMRKIRKERAKWRMHIVDVPD